MSKTKMYTLNGFKVMEVEETASTNTLAEELRPGLEDRTVVLTYRQTRGRGQVGNCWESEPGKNISMTVVLKPNGLSAGRQFAVSMAVALGVRDFVSLHVPDCTVKWPNDVYVGDKKVAGILIEHTVMGREVAASLCGVGLNVNQERFWSDAPNPVSLRQLTGREFSLKEVLGGLLSVLERRLNGLFDFEGLERDFRAALYRREGVHRWADEEGEFQASVAGINEFGQLLLRETSGRERVYSFKEVRYL